MSLTERIADLEADLAKLRAEAAATGVTPGPGIAPAPPAAPVKWWRDPGTPLEGTGPFPTAYDDIPTCKRYAAQGVNPSGIRSLLGHDLALALELCDFLNADTTTAQQAEDRLNGAGYMDPQAASFALLTGWAQGFPAQMSAPSLFTVKGRIADLCHAPGAATASVAK